MESQEPTRDEYTIGWVCALPIEAAVAKSMLDRSYRPLPLENPNNTNAYSLGRIAEHNVVIAHLPAGSYGTTSAAVTVTNLLSSFPNIRFGLLVGIGGGIPSKSVDIRLGDVVISKPDKASGGVVQLDLGKATDEGFQRTGSLNRPPTVLLTSIAMLEAEHILGSQNVPLYMSAACQKFPPLQSLAKSPGADKDILFISSYDHRVEDQDSNTCQDCDSSQLVVREPRYTQDPAIHYGLIASSNTVVKNSRVRDEIQKEGFLCFEMEAAGVMNDFPCLVIRGICDYSDSHKNKNWQAYAALAAAAYAKELLYSVQAIQAEATPKAADVLQGIAEEIEKVANEIQESRYDRHTQQIHEWLRPVDSSDNYHRALALAKEYPDSCSGSWFLHGKEYTAWKSAKTASLWLHGLPGCGKTVLSSSIIEDLRTSEGMLLSFYFDFSDQSKKSFERMARSLISQLYDLNKASRPVLDSLFQYCRNGRETPSIHACLGALFEMITRSEGKHVYIVLDALDECSDERNRLLDWLSDLAQLSTDGLHLLLTSRKEPDINLKLGQTKAIGYIVPVHTDSVNEEIRTYVHNMLQKGQKFQRWRQRLDVQKEIETTLVEKSDGMFRWAACQLEILSTMTDRRTVRTALSSLPTTLYDTYTRIMESIPGEQKENAKRILQLLAYSDQPLSLDELSDALAIDPEASPCFDPADRTPIPEDIIGICSSLVTTYTNEKPRRGSSRTCLQLAHFSVQQYLMSDQVEQQWGSTFSETVVMASLLKLCLAYCSVCPYRGVSAGISTDIDFPFAHYSALKWPEFAAKAEASDSSLWEHIYKFLLDDHCSVTWNSMYLSWSKENKTPSGITTLWLPFKSSDISAPTPIQQACSFGLINLLIHLLENGVDVNALIPLESDMQLTPLYLASQNGHLQTVEALLDRKAQPNRIPFWSELCVAIIQDQEEVALALIKHGADPNSHHAISLSSQRCGEKWQIQTLKRMIPRARSLRLWRDDEDWCITALQLACLQGSRSILDALIGKGAAVNLENPSMEVADILQQRPASPKKPPESNFFTTLEAACNQPDRRIIHKIIDCGAYVDDGLSLAAACSEGFKDVVRLLLDRGADVNKSHTRCGSPLIAASIGGHAEIVHTLLDNGADVNLMVQRYLYTDALSAACGSGQTEIARILLERGANINPRLQSPSPGIDPGSSHFDADIRPLIHQAVDNQELELVQVLIEAGVNIEAKGEHDYTALHRASMTSEWDGERGEKIIKKLLTAGADVGALSDESATALHLAVYSGNHWAVSALLESDADTEIPDSLGNTAIAYCEDPEVLSTLLEAGANVERADETGDIPLVRAVKATEDSIVKVLLGLKPDINRRYPPKGMSLLHLVSSNGGGSPERFKNTVVALLQAGADINARSTMHSMTPLHMAASNSCEYTTEVLIASGADIDTRCSKGRTSLHFIATGGNLEVCRLLLDAGANFEIRDKQHGMSPLHRAALYGNYKMIKILADAGANIRDRCLANGMTALHYATLSSETFGDRVVSTRDSREPYNFLEQAEHSFDQLRSYKNDDATDPFGDDLKSTETLLRLGAEINVQCYIRGSTPLHIAARDGRINILQRLLDHSAKVDISDTSGRTPLDYAVESEHVSAAETLSQYLQATTSPSFGSQMHSIRRKSLGTVGIEESNSAWIASPSQHAHPRSASTPPQSHRKDPVTTSCYLPLFFPEIIEPSPEIIERLKLYGAPWDSTKFGPDHQVKRDNEEHAQRIKAYLDYAYSRCLWVH